VLRQVKRSLTPKDGLAQLIFSQSRVLLNSGFACSLLWRRRSNEAQFPNGKQTVRDGSQATATEIGRACWRLSARVSVYRPISYSVSGSAPGLGVVMLIVSYSVTRTTPGTGSSITSIIVSSTTGTFRLGAFLDAVFAVVFHGRFSAWRALPPSCARPWRLPSCVSRPSCAQTWCLPSDASWLSWVSQYASLP
jgi:hypothetical protein